MSMQRRLVAQIDVKGGKYFVSLYTPLRKRDVDSPTTFEPDFQDELGPFDTEDEANEKLREIRETLRKQGQLSESDRFVVIARARSLGDPELAFRPIGEINNRSENEAIVLAYAIVREDMTLNVGEYWLVRDEKPQTYDSRITIHKGAVPVCYVCWGKNSQEFQLLRRYKNPAGVRERCSLCGNGTTEAWFTWFPSQTLLG
jgi:hypothetical protein